jgi:hypothetical protein
MDEKINSNVNHMLSRAVIAEGEYSLKNAWLLFWRQSLQKQNSL